MITKQSYKVAGPDIVFEQFDGDLVVLNLGTGQYFGFNAAAAAVWTVLMAGIQPGQMIECGQELSSLDSFVERLLALGLVVPDPQGSGTLTDAFRSLLTTDTSPPTVDTYDDLADLIVADPIHDVDQRIGWPHLVPGVDDVRPPA